MVTDRKRRCWPFRHRWECGCNWCAEHGPAIPGVGCWDHGHVGYCWQACSRCNARRWKRVGR